ncbi:hypothetical protein BT96DRAFT_988090 [Gymnopus androsaceus JB14]|uniref:Uncharacterized protein n=1 Tax=Gymnopus androsaceus JB14 TaxID=1447944 RepID=A0A6A4I9U6_9AGAR|nr:hypothetical protein BT96DRAFT_988090 [Gymnopus androsaceus JB14]
MSNQKLFHLVLTAGMIMGIIGISDSTGSSPSSSGMTLRKASVIVFLVLTLLLEAYQTFTLVMAERLEDPKTRTQNLGDTIGARHRAIIFGAIAGLLLVREIYLVSTISSTIKQNKEETWYPLVALPKLMCVVLYALPGIIPPTPSSCDSLP